MPSERHLRAEHPVLLGLPAVPLLRRDPPVRRQLRPLRRLQLRPLPREILRRRPRLQRSPAPVLNHALQQPARGTRLAVEQEQSGTPEDQLHENSRQPDDKRQTLNRNSVCL